MSDMTKMPRPQGKRATIRLAAADLARISAAALGDETLSQTLRRIVRESSQAAAREEGKRSA